MNDRRPNRNKRSLSYEEELQQRKVRNRHALIWYYVIGFILTLLALIAFFFTFQNSVTNAPHWRKLADKMQPSDVMMPASRGNIYSCTGPALAISVPMYKTYIDFGAAGFKDSVYLGNVDSLAFQLSEYFGNKSKAAYKNDLMSIYNKYSKRHSKGGKGRVARLLPFEVNHTQMKALRKMPYLRIPNANNSGLVTEMSIRRNKPFGSMASRTIGFLEKDVDSLLITHGSSGLELSYDSILCGKPGIDARIRVPQATLHKTKVKPINGSDIYTTLNIEIQDITERCLRDMLIEREADWGCAIVMEVATGEIKAISNLDRGAGGAYYERTNHALADLLEPGSTFKVPSIMAVLEEGTMEPSDTIDVGNGLYPYKGAVVRDHNAHKGGYGRISMAQAIWYSSNVGVVKSVLNAFEGRPEAYLKHLDQMSFFAPMRIEIPGAAQARIRRDLSTWSKISLAWISFGYETQIPPIFTCRFYNAIANNGKMMQPFLVKEIRNESGKREVFKPEVVNDKIASDATIKKMQQMLLDVVENGTGKIVHSPYISIAGKTGTAQRTGGGGGYRSMGHNVAFCGYFPVDNPKYTCMVTVGRPRVGYPSAGAISGVVVKNIAEQIYATTMTRSVNELRPDSLATFTQYYMGGNRNAIRNVVKMTGVKSAIIEGKGEWLVPMIVRPDQTPDDSIPRPAHYELAGADIEPGIVPDVTGLALSDAVYCAERSGLYVSIRGAGAKVKEQSMKAGSKFSGRPRIVLTIN